MKVVANFLDALVKLRHMIMQSSSLQGGGDSRVVKKDELDDDDLTK